MKDFFRDNVEKLHGYQPGFQPADPAAVKINTNENPYPPSPAVFEAMAKLDGDSFRKYPPVYWDKFRRVASDVHSVRPEMVCCGNGADELLTMLVRCCCGRQRAMAYPVLTYSLYPVLAAIQNCPVIEVPFGTNGSIPEKLHDTGASLTILCNPNAPTGTIVSADEAAKLAEKVAGVLAIDEAYVDFAQGDCLSLLNDFDNVVILRSMSKGYSLAGMRFGYAIGSRRIIEAMEKVKDSYNVNVATQAAATAALADQEYFRANIARIKEQRGRLTTALREMGFTVPDSQTNFLLVRIDKPPAAEIYEKLVQQNIYIRYFKQKELNDKLRISVGSAKENNALLAVLREIV